MENLNISCEAFMNFCDSMIIENEFYTAIESTLCDFDIALENKLIDGAKKALKSVVAALYRKCDQLYRKCKNKDSKAAKILKTLSDFFYKHSNSIEEINDEDLLEEEKEKINKAKEKLREAEDIIDAEWRPA